MSDTFEDKPKHFCGLFGIFGHDASVELTYYGLYALQHRGEESAGIVSCRPDALERKVGMGLVADVFSEADFTSLAGRAAIGHTRYSTTGRSDEVNAQPILARFGGGREVALAHNGNLTNASALREELDRHGSIFQTTSDSEVILHLIARENSRSLELSEILPDVLRRLEGSFSLVLLSRKRMYAVRDRHGFRPLLYGKLGKGWIVASESSAFDQTGATVLGSVEPGEMLIFDDEGMRREPWAIPMPKTPSHCVFEHVYFARPDSLIFGDNVHKVRMALGRALAQEWPADADIVVGIPDSGTDAAMGYAEASKLPLEVGFVRNHYVGRTFIRPNQALRSKGVELKLNPVRAVIEGKRVVVVDDSIVRGTTSQSRVRLLRRVGAKEIHLRISCPPIRNACYFGIDFPDPKELVATGRTNEQIAEFLGVDTIRFLSEAAMLGVMSNPASHYCTACFSGRYPVTPRTTMEKTRFEARPGASPSPTVT